MSQMCAEAKNVGVSCMSGAAVAMNAILSKCHSLELERVGRVAIVWCDDLN